MGTAGCGYYSVNCPHATEREAPPGDDHSDIRESVTWKKEPSKRPRSALPPAYRICVGASCGLAAAAVCSETQLRIIYMFPLVVSMSFGKVPLNVAQNVYRTSRKSDLMCGTVGCTVRPLTLEKEVESMMEIGHFLYLMS